MKYGLIEGFEDLYAIIVNGDVVSLLKQEKHSQYIGNHGYLVVDLWRNNKRKKFLVHRLLAISFIPNPNQYKYVNHLDGNKLNNNLDNLEWCTMDENNKHAFRTGLMNSMIKKQRALNWEEAEFVRLAYNLGYAKQKDLAKFFGVSVSCICQIVKHRTYNIKIA